MSAFGYGTFKQHILDEVEWRAKDAKLSNREVLTELAELLAYLAAYGKDDE